MVLTIEISDNEGDYEGVRLQNNSDEYRRLSS